VSDFAASQESLNACLVEAAELVAVAGGSVLEFQQVAQPKPLGLRKYLELQTLCLRVAIGLQTKVRWVGDGV
jgi:hypothetical protein